MATLVPTLTLTSSDATSEALNLSVTDSLTVTIPAIGISRVTITTDDNQELVDDPSDDFLRFLEFAFFPINDGAGLEARADTASCVLEYAYWTKG